MSQKHTSDSATTTKPRNTYWIAIAATGAGLLSVGVFTLFPPAFADAFWFFSVSKAANEGEPPIVHDASMNLLSAATNPDPNPNKGGIDLPISGGSALVANTGPEGTVATYTENLTKGGQISLHVVREGESLSEIASLYNVSISTILWANDIKDAKTIQPGDELLILPVTGVQHTVAKGETLAGIAKKYSADADEIAAFNGIDGTVAVGDTLIIPGGDLAPKTTTKKTTSSTASVTAKALPAISGYYGNPVPGAKLTQGVHGYNGVDLGAPNGTPVYAAAEGSVIVAKANGGYNGGYGNYVVISHPNGTQTLYAHLSSVSVSVGSTVSKGTRIGAVGITGRATGYHLHFEVRGAKNPFAN